MQFLNMAEFRLFFPVLDRVKLQSSLSCHSALPQITKLYELYEGCIQQLSVFKLSELDKSRTDRYVCGSCNYGLKFRNGTRLELKVMQKNNCKIPGVECYYKEKLNKNLTLEDEKFSKKVKRILNEMGNFDEANDSLLDNSNNRLSERCLDITKRRCNNYVGEWDACVEYCDIHCWGPTSQPTAVHPKWISIALESGDFEFFNAIHPPTSGSMVSVANNKGSQSTLLWKCLILSMQLIQLIVAEPCGSNFYGACPILGGYPSFVSYVIDEEIGAPAAKFDREVSKIRDFVKYVIENYHTPPELSNLLNGEEPELDNESNKHPK